MVTCEEMSMENLLEKFERLFHHVYRQQTSSRMDREPLLRLLNREQQIRSSESLRNNSETNNTQVVSTSGNSDPSQGRSNASNSGHSGRSNSDHQSSDESLDTSATVEDLVTALPVPSIVESPPTLRSVDVSSRSSSGTSVISARRVESSANQDNFEFEGVPIAPGDVPDFPRVVILAALGSQTVREQRNRRVFSRTGAIFM